MGLSTTPKTLLVVVFSRGVLRLHRRYRRVQRAAAELAPALGRALSPRKPGIPPEHSLKYNTFVAEGTSKRCPTATSPSANTKTHCKAKRRINSEERGGEGGKQRKFAALEQHDEGFVLQVLCPQLPCDPSSLLCCLESHLLILTGDSCHVFPILHLNITIMLGYEVGSEALAGRTGRVGVPLPGYPKSRRGWLV